MDAISAGRAVIRVHSSVKARLAYCLFETMSPRPRWSEKHVTAVAPLGGAVRNIFKLCCHVALACILGLPRSLFGCQINSLSLADEI